jgi:uncharacterized protein YxeA
MLNIEDLRNIAEIIVILRNIVSILVIIIAGIWGFYKIKEYREFKQWIQFEIEANIYKLKTPTEKMDPFILEKDGKRRNTQPKKHTHAVEVVLKFTNKGKRRLRIYNIQTKISTMPTEYVKRGEGGYLSLRTIFNSGNIVPKGTGFYYIEPQVEQVITFLTLITEPRELLRVNGKFSLEQDRIFPKKEVLLKYPSPLKQIYKLFPCLEKYVSSKKNSFLCKQIFKRFPRLKKYVTRKPRLLGRLC